MIAVNSKTFTIHATVTCPLAFPDDSLLDAVEISSWINQGYDLKFKIFANDNLDFGMPFMEVNSTDGI